MNNWQIYRPIQPLNLCWIDTIFTLMSFPKESWESSFSENSIRDPLAVFTELLFSESCREEGMIILPNALGFTSSSGHKRDSVFLPGKVPLSKQVILFLEMVIY